MPPGTYGRLPMPDDSRFRQLQYQLAAHIRDPQATEAPHGIEDRRLAIYRELFFNNVASLLAGTFPVLRQVLGKERWHKLIRAWFASHQSHTPYFLEVSRDFLGFLETPGAAAAGLPAFALELAHYEWIELALSVAEDEPDLQEVDRDGDLLGGEPVVSTLAEVLRYRYPVHTIGPDNQPEEPPAEPTWLVVVRDLEDRVGFVHINAVTARLLELATAGGQTGAAMLSQIATELEHQRPEVVIDGGVELLKMLRKKDIILGSKRTDKKEG